MPYILVVVNIVYFCGFIPITTYLPSLSFLQTFPCNPSNYLSSPWPLLFINCYCMHTCICLCIHIPKCNLLSPYSVSWTYVFRASHLSLRNQLVCSSHLSFQIYSVAWRSPCRVKSSHDFCLQLCHPFSAHIWVDILLRLYGCSFWC